MAGQKVQRGGVAYTAQAAAARHKRPCRSAPATPDTFVVTYFRSEVHHRKVWAARVKWSPVTKDVAGRPLTVEAYEVQLRATDASGVPVEVDGTDHDFWSRLEPAHGPESNERVVFRPLPRPSVNYFQARIRVLNRVHGGKCWSAWTAWTTPTQPVTGAEAGPPAPTGVTLVLDKVEGTAKHPWRARVGFNARTDYEPDGGDGVLEVVGYAVQLAVSNNGGSTTANVRTKHVPDTQDASTYHANFFNIRGKRWYRARVKAKGADGNWGAWSTWTSWLSPHGAPGPVTNLTWSTPTPGTFVARWDPPTDPTDAVQYHVKILRGSTIVDEGFTASNRWVYHIPLADRGAAHKARVSTQEDDIFLDVDLGAPAGATPGDESSAVDSSLLTNTQQWPFDALTHTDGLPPASSPAATATVPNIPRTVNITWPEIANPDPVTYDLYRHTSASFTPPGTGTRVYSGAGTAFIDTSGTAGTAYYYRVIARDADGSAAPGAVSGPATPLSQATDGVAPASSPAITAVGGPRWIACTWAAVPNTDDVTYDVHLSTTAGFTPSAATLVASLAGTVAFIRKDGAGADLAYDTNYYLKVVARDRDGSAAAGPETGPVRLDPAVADDIAAGSITVDKLAAVLIISNALKTADSGRRVEIDEAGVRLIDSDETVLANLPTDPETPASFQGELLAEALTATGATEFRSTLNTLTKDAVLTLLAGQQAPTVAPRLSSSIEMMPFNASPSEPLDNNPSQRGAFGYDSGSGYFYYIFTNGDTWQFVRVDSSGMEVDRTTMSHGAAAFTTGGIVKIGSYWYGLFLNSVADPDWYIWADSGGKPTGSPTVRNYNGWTGWYMPQIATDGTDVFVCQSDMGPFGGTTKAQILRYTVSGTAAPAFVSMQLTSDTGAGSSDIIGYVRSSADFGAMRNIILTRLDSTIRSYNNAGVAQSNENWTNAETSSSGWVGLAWDGANFFQMASNSLAVYKYSTFQAAGAKSTKFYVAYTWYDSRSTGGTHETALSPRASITLKNRRRMSISWPTIPDSGGPDDANKVRLYMKASTSDPGPLFSSYYRQGTTYGGTQTYLETYSTSTVGAQDTPFPGGAGAKISSTDTTMFAPLTGSGDGFIPRGAIMMWPLATAPLGWLKCDGSAVSRTTYADLYNALTSGVTRTTPTVRAVGAVAAGIGSITPGLPAGTVAGDLLLMFVENSGSAGGVTAAGWTVLAVVNTTGVTLTILYKIATGTDATTTDDVGNHQLGRIIGITVGTWDSRTAPLLLASNVQESPTTAVSITGGTTETDNSLVLFASAGDLPDADGTAQFAGIAASSLTSVTERIDNTTSQGNGGALFVGSGVLATAGATGDMTATAADAAVRANASLYIKGAQVLTAPFGDGDGYTTFNVPDLRGRFVIGAGTFAVLGESDGLAESERTPRHDHGVGTLTIADHPEASNTTTGGTANRVKQGEHSITGRTGKTAASDQPYMGLHYIIKT